MSILQIPAGMTLPCAAFYNGLPDRIKDEMVHIGGRPRTFTDMKTIPSSSTSVPQASAGEGGTSRTTSDSSRAPAASASNSSSSAPSTNAPQNPSRAPRPAAAAGPSKSGPAAPGQKKPSDIAANLNTDGRLCEEERSGAVSTTCVSTAEMLHTW